MAYVVGMDGCRGGWIAVFRDLDRKTWEFQFISRAEQVLADARRPIIVAIDMPMGFVDIAQKRGRLCEREARQLLPGATSRVFSSPCRRALKFGEYGAASAANRSSGPDQVGLSRQSFALFPKMLELDSLQRSTVQTSSLREAHPELAFARMNRGTPVAETKHTRAGEAKRGALLAAHGYPNAIARWERYRDDKKLRRTDAKLDDALDAVAVCRTAEFIHAGNATRLPAGATLRDRHGIEMAIWY